MSSNITYEEALGTLDAMFGAPWTQDHLDTVLRHFQGHMENTVEAVLNHGNGTPESLLAKLKSPGSINGEFNADTSMDAEIARELSAQMQKEELKNSTNAQSSRNNKNFPAMRSPVNQYNLNSRFESQSTPASSSGTASREQLKPNGKKWIGTPTDLPADFLRLPGFSSKAMTSASGGANPDLDADEALARMLQDSLFTEELANNPEFAHLARGHDGGVGFVPPKMNLGRNKNNGNGNMMEGPNIVDKLSEMGDNAKKRLAVFAAQWNAKRNGNIPTENAERRGLLDDTINEEKDTRGGRNVEMKSLGFNWRGEQSKKKD